MKRKTTLFIAAAAPYGSAVAASSPTRLAATTVGVTSTPLGRVVADGNGRTLYLFEKDTTRRSACYGQCANYWPPLLTQSTPLTDRKEDRVR